MLNDNALGNKILIIGCCGAGKTYLTKRLARQTGRPLIQLDREYFGPGWQRPPANLWRQRIAALCAQPQWIMDGNYKSTLDFRLTFADTVIFLDIPRSVCLLRVLKRIFIKPRKQEEMAEGCKERWDWPFIKYVWHFHKHIRPRLLVTMEAHAINIICLNNTKAVKQFGNAVSA